VRASKRDDPLLWPRRLARALVACTFALLLAGGLVTTYRVGMAVPDWPTTFGYGMFRYPLERMLADFGVTVEHGHRLAASGVGLLSIAVLLVALRRAARSVRFVALAGLAVELVAFASLAAAFDPEVGTSAATLGLFGLTTALFTKAAVTGGAPPLVRLALAAHLGVVLQGLLGGSRVLANHEGLAFLHGAFAQVVYALVFALGVVTSRAWTDAAPPIESSAAPDLRRAARAATALVYLQVALGAWLRHSGLPLALGLHVLLALGVVGAIVALAHQLDLAARALADGSGARRTLGRARGFLIGVLGLQIALGIASTAAIYLWSGGFQGAVSIGEALGATAHVAVGALLLGSCSGTWLLAHRLLRSRGEAAPALAPHLEVAA